MRSPRLVAGSALIVLVYFVLGLTDVFTRAPWCDEAWFGNPAYNLAYKGFMGTTVLEPTGSTWKSVKLTGIDRHTYWVMPLSLLVNAAGFRAFGFSILSMRLLSLFWGLIALCAWGVILWTLTSQLLLTLGSLGLIAVDYHFLMQASDGRAESSVSSLLSSVESRLDGQDLAVERKLIDDIRAALPEGTQTFWDMTIAAYWAWSAWNPEGAPIHTAQGAGGLGYGLPGALGAAVAGGPTLAVSGDGGAMYGVAELATAVQHDLDVTWLIIDDGGYGVLREYLTGTFGHTTATELARPDFVALASSFGVPARLSSSDKVGVDLAEALRTPGPSVVVLPALLKLFAPTHLEQA